MNDTVNIFMLYQFLRRLVLPFERWEAFKLGIIDAKGEILIPTIKFTEPAQYKAWGKFDVLVRNLKRLLAKVPGGQSVMGSYAAAFLLLKEGEDKLSDASEDDLQKSIEDLLKDLEGLNLDDLIDESEVPTNVAGGVAGAESVAQRKLLRRRSKKEIPPNVS